MISVISFVLVASQVFDPYALPPRYQGQVVPTTWRPPVGFNERVVALTFDDGPHQVQTMPILNILKSEGVTATMFLVGQWVDRYRSPMVSEKNLGLELANHTYTHPSWPSVLAAAPEVTMTDRGISGFQKPHSKLFRPPYGQHSGNTSLYARSLGMASVLWTNDSHDWELTDSLAAVNNVVSNMSPGDIVLMHDNRSCTPGAVRPIIQAYRAAGYQFITVTQMLWRWDAYLSSHPEAELLSLATPPTESSRRLSEDAVHSCCAE